MENEWELMEAAYQEVADIAIVLDDFSPEVRQEFYALGGTREEWIDLQQQTIDKAEANGKRRRTGADVMSVVSVAAVGVAIIGGGVPAAIIGSVCFIGSFLQGVTADD